MYLQQGNKIQSNLQWTISEVIKRKEMNTSIFPGFDAIFGGYYSPFDTS